MSTCRTWQSPCRSLTSFCGSSDVSCRLSGTSCATSGASLGMWGASCRRRGVFGWTQMEERYFDTIKPKKTCKISTGPSANPVNIRVYIRPSGRARAAWAWASVREGCARVIKQLFLAREQKNSGKKFFLFIEHEVLFYEMPFLQRARRIYVCGATALARPHLEEVSSSVPSSLDFWD
jgi:hypothetical protein